MRQALKDTEIGLDPKFRYRGKNQTRLETLSDAAFALSMTLVILSSSVPENFAELKLSMRNVVPFLICVTLLTIIWFQHYIFFLRYGLQNATVVFINSILIFLILVYVYPLKFLARFLFEWWYAFLSGNWEYYNLSFSDQVNSQNMEFLMVIYGVGAMSIFIILAWLYTYAHKKRMQLELDKYEIFSTRTSLYVNLLLASVPLLSVVIVALNIPGGNSTFIVGGMTYMIYPLVMITFGARRARLSKKLFGEGK